MQFNCFPTQQSCNDDRLEIRVYNEWGKMHTKVAFLKKEYLRYKNDNRKAAPSGTSDNLVRIYGKSESDTVLLMRHFPSFMILLLMTISIRRQKSMKS